MIFENLGVANIAAQGINRAVAAHVHHFEDRGATLGGRREKARSQRVAGEQRGIEPDALGMNLDDIGDALIGEPIADLAALADRAEQRPGGDAGRIEPSP